MQKKSTIVYYRFRFYNNPKIAYVLNCSSDCNENQIQSTLKNLFISDQDSSKLEIIFLDDENRQVNFEELVSHQIYYIKFQALSGLQIKCFV